MRFALAISLAVCAACNASAAGSQEPTPAPRGEDPGSAVSGKLLERIDAGSYSYLRIASAAGEVWAAVPTTALPVGAPVSVEQPLWMQDFESKTLGRKWPRIAFGTLSGSGAGGAAEPHPAALADAPGGPAGRMPSDALHAFTHPSAPRAADVGGLKVARAPGSSGRTVAEVFAQRTALSGQEVAVRGKVVKFTAGVLGRNWIHLRDGTGVDGGNDLTVTSDESCAVGDVVLARGTARLDQDFGAGYRYPVLLEGARLQAR
jgi:hypothetical protein